MTSFGILGLGTIAKIFADAAAYVENVQIAAVACRSAVRAQEFAEKYHIHAIYDDYEKLLSDPKVQVVYVALTNHLHYEWTKRSLLAGKSVVCEKPFVLHAAQAKELAALAREKNLFLMEATWTRFMPAVNQIKRWLKDGRIGQLRMGDAAFCMNSPGEVDGRKRNPALGGGALFDVGVYSLEFLLDFFGNDPVSVSGQAYIGDTGVDYGDVVTLRYADGKLATAGCSFVTRGNFMGSLYGSEGQIHARQFYCCKYAELCDPNGKVLEVFEDNRGVPGFVYEIEHIRDCLNAKLTESPRIPLADTIACAEIFDHMITTEGIRAD